MNKLFRRLAGFSALPLISALTPLLLLPVVARLGGSEGWASIAIGQSIGAFGAVAVGYGVHLTGPVAVLAEKEEKARKATYFTVTSARLFLLAIVMPICLGLSYFLAASGYRLDAALMSCSMVLFGVSPSWYLIGLGRPKPIAQFETVPKLIATGISLGLLLLTGLIWIYPLALIIATLAGLGLFHKRFFNSYLLPVQSWAATRAYLIENFKVATTAGISSAYVAAPIPVASSSQSYANISELSSGDRLYRYGLFTVVALGNALQSWVLEGEGGSKRKNQRVAVFSHVVLGAVGFGFLAIWGQEATALLFGADVATNPSVSFWYGLAFLCISISTPFVRNVLIPARKMNFVLAGGIASATLGLPAMLVGSALAGISGIAFGLALSELVSLVFALAGAYYVREGGKPRPAGR